MTVVHDAFIAPRFPLDDTMMPRRRLLVARDNFWICVSRMGEPITLLSPDEARWMRDILLRFVPPSADVDLDRASSLEEQWLVLDKLQRFAKAPTDREARS